MPDQVPPPQPGRVPESATQSVSQPVARIFEGSLAVKLARQPPEQLLEQESEFWRAEARGKKLALVASRPPTCDAFSRADVPWRRKEPHRLPGALSAILAAKAVMFLE